MPRQAPVAFWASRWATSPLCKDQKITCLYLNTQCASQAQQENISLAQHSICLFCVEHPLVSLLSTYHHSPFPRLSWEFSLCNQLSGSLQQPLITHSFHICGLFIFSPPPPALFNFFLRHTIHTYNLCFFPVTIPYLTITSSYKPPNYYLIQICGNLLDTFLPKLDSTTPTHHILLF